MQHRKNSDAVKADGSRIHDFRELGNRLFYLNSGRLIITFLQFATDFTRDHGSMIVCEHQKWLPGCACYLITAVR